MRNVMSKKKRPDEQEYELVEHTATRKAIGDRTLRSVNEAPQFRVQKLVVMDALMELRGKLKEAGGDSIPTYNDILIKVAAGTLRDFPRLNAWWDEAGLKLLTNINIGFAVDTEDGVMLPTVLNADTKSLAEIAAETAELIDLARRGRLRATLQMGAGFTVSNIGPTGIDVFDAIISPPQTGILAVGSIMPRPIVENGDIVVRNTMWASLTIDHRSVDGADGARFLAQLAEALQYPQDAV
jgi:pyruvate dehydrogenase E2 component (dihydrolipoamide acetyltransferase)